MPLSSEKVENRPLTGPEVKDFVCHLVRRAMDGEWAFNQGSAYPRIGIEVTLKFHFLSASMPKINPIVRVEAPLESAPLKGVPENANEGVLALKIEKTVENPNLERVHAGMPITVTSKTGALPGQMFPRVEHHQVTYDPADYPEAEPPTITDLTEETAKDWDVKLQEAPPEAPEPEPVRLGDIIHQQRKQRGRPKKNV